MMIITRTPFRISFLGGGSDYPSWHKDHIGMVLGASIDKYCYLTLDYKPKFLTPRYRLVYSKIEECSQVEDIQHPAIKATLQYTGMDGPLELLHASDLPAQSGIGSSSAFVVGLLTALYPSSKHQAKVATIIEQSVLQEPIGCQDQILTARGGINQIVWHPFHPNPVIRTIWLSSDRVHELEDHLLLLYTGPRRQVTVGQMDTGANAQRLRRIAGMVKEGVDVLQSDTDINVFGILLHESWMLKRELASNITNPDIDCSYQTALGAGAVGGKLLGSGGGGFMLLFAHPEFHQAILDRLSHLIHIPFHFEFEGSKVLHAS